MDDAIDDWLLRQIHWLRREDVIALGIRWVQDVRTNQFHIFFFADYGATNFVKIFCLPSTSFNEMF